MASNFISLATPNQIQSQFSPVIQPNPVYPWFSRNQLSWLDSQVTDVEDETEKERKKNEIYRQALPVIKERAFQEKKKEASNVLFAQSLDETDPIKKKQIQTTVKLWDLAEQLRVSKWLPAMIPDNEVIQAFVWEDVGKIKQVTDFLNGTNEDILYTTWLKQKPEEEWMSTLWKIWVWALWVVWTLIGGKVWGEVLKKAGKSVYGLTIPSNIQEAGQKQAYQAGLTNTKPRTVVDTAIESPLLQKWGNTMSSKLWQMGTKWGVWVQAQARASQIFKETITPIFKQSVKDNVTFDYGTLFEQAKSKVLDTTKRSVEQKNSIISDIERIAKKYKWVTTLENLDLAKRDIVNQLPQKYFKWNPTSDLKEAQWVISNVFRDTVHTTIKDKYWVNSAKLYQDYANFKQLWEIGKKAMTQWGTSAWFGSFVSTVAQEAVTPLSTTVGKVTYKLWDFLTKPTDFLLKKWKELIKSWAIKNIIKETPANILAPDFSKTKQDFHTNMVEDAKQAIKLLDEWKKIPASNFAYTLWNNLSKEDKIQKLKDVINSKAPKNNTTPLEFLLDKIF